MTEAIQAKDLHGPTLSTDAVVQIGGHRRGRGFIVGAGRDHYIVTAAHCLPRSRYPRPHLGNSTPELTLPNLVGPLGAKRGRVWTELCVLGLVDDIAVLCTPDDQELSEQADRYEQFTADAMSVAGPPAFVKPYRWEGEVLKPVDVPGSKAWVLSLDGKWQSCLVHNINGRQLSLSGVEIKSGMSGSPILNADGAAIGLISTGTAEDNRNPSLMDCLPPWLWRKLSRIEDGGAQLVSVTETGLKS